MKSDPNFIPFKKKLTLNGLRPDTVKLVEGNAGYKFRSIGPGNGFFDRTPKKKKPHKQHKKNTQNYIKLKGFCTAKKKLNELKRQLNDWEKIFVNHVSDKGLISKTEKRALQLNSKKQTT